MLVFAVHAVAPVTTTSSPKEIVAIAVIPARYEATRLPGKPLLDIAGRSMVEHVYNRAKQATRINRVVVATDDVRIVDAVQGFGGDAYMTSPSHRSGSDRLAELMHKVPCDIVVNVQCDEPLIEPTLIDALVESIGQTPGAHIATAYAKVEKEEELQDPNTVKVVLDQNNYALYFSRAAIPGTPSRPSDSTLPVGHKHIGVYAYRRSALLELAEVKPTPLERQENLEQLRALESGYRILAIETKTPSMGIDTIDDLEKVRRYISNGVHV